MALVDRGEPIDYGYRDPMTGKPFPPSTYARPDTRAPVCDCSKRDSNEEWVSWPATTAAGDAVQVSDRSERKP